MNPKYRFFLQINDGEKTAVNPIYSDDMTLDYEMESNQRFYRAKLSGNFNFIRQDYAIIMATSFDAIYYLYIEKSDDWGQTYSQYYKAMFMRTDCTIDVDDQMITVQPQPIDQYNDVLAGLEKEFNLIELAPEIKRVSVKKRPLIQIYIPGENIISCFLSGLSWEQDVTAESDESVLQSKYHFAKLKKIISSTFSVREPSNETEQNFFDSNPWIKEAAGTYVGELSGDYILTNIETGYYMKAERPGQYGSYNLYNSDNQLLAWSDSAPADPTISGTQFHFDFAYDVGDEEIVYAHYYYLYQSSWVSVPIMGRYLLDVDSILDVNTYELPTDDIVSNNRNYRRAIGFGFPTTIRLSLEFSDTPTQYGLAENGQYYLPPYSIFGQKYYPIARTLWGNYSVWFAFHELDEIFEQLGTKQYTLRDNYPVSSCLSVLLAKIAPGIQHEASPEYSEFLYNGVNPISGYIFQLLVSPKSNILVGDYQTPVQKAPTTLQQFLDMLRNTFQLYWHIEDNKLRIEHISWYKNGGSYGGSEQNIGYDLTALENVRNGKKWAFATSQYSFDKEDLPERYQFKWMDSVSSPFEGQAIQVVSKYVKAGKIEEINIGNFTSDIDLMMLNPEVFSQDGFALLAAFQRGDTLELPLVRYDKENVSYQLQNGYVAMVSLQPLYWLYDMPAYQLIVDDVEMQAYGIQRRKTQTLSFPITEVDDKLMQLVKTNIGNGEIQKLSINLSSKTAKATLKYDTE